MLVDGTLPSLVIVFWPSKDYVSAFYELDSSSDVSEVQFDIAKRNRLVQTIPNSIIRRLYACVTSTITPPSKISAPLQRRLALLEALAAN